MSELYLVFRNLTRNKLRLFLNATAIVIAFMLFGVLYAVKGAFDQGLELTADNRMIVTNKINFTQPLPIAHINKIRAVDGIKDVSWGNWFGAYVGDAQNQVVGLAVEPASWLKVYDELELSDEDRNAWFGNRQGMVVGHKLAERNGWQRGDRIPVSSSIFSRTDGGHTWELVISGIFTSREESTDTNYFLFNYTYFIETQTFGSDWFGWAVITTQDPALNEQVAKAIDTRFANSPAETKTTSERQFTKSFIEQLGSIGLIITSVVGAAFFTILLIVGNTMALSVRERTGEIAVLKTLGFQASSVFRMVLGESLMLSLLGGLSGLGIAWFVVKGASENPQLSNILPNLFLGAETVLSGLICMLVLGVLTGLLPARQAMTLNTIDALNRR